jgi:hypothetical protein
VFIDLHLGKQSTANFVRILHDKHVDVALPRFESLVPFLPHLSWK